MQVECQCSDVRGLEPAVERFLEMGDRGRKRNVWKMEDILLRPTSAFRGALQVSQAAGLSLPTGRLGPGTFWGRRRRVKAVRPAESQAGDRCGQQESRRKPLDPVLYRVGACETVSPFSLDEVSEDGGWWNLDGGGRMAGWGQTPEYSYPSQGVHLLHWCHCYSARGLVAAAARCTHAP